MTKTTKKVVQLAPGRTIEVFSVKHLAGALGRSTQSIVLWERNGQFPKPILNCGENLRWYTKLEIDTYREILDLYGVGSRVDSLVFFRGCLDARVRMEKKLREYVLHGGTLETENKDPF